VCSRKKKKRKMRDKNEERKYLQQRLRQNAVVIQRYVQMIRTLQQDSENIRKCVTNENAIGCSERDVFAFLDAILTLGVRSVNIRYLKSVFPALASQRLAFLLRKWKIRQSVACGLRLAKTGVYYGR
jgi:hypothetical protein